MTFNPKNPGNIDPGTITLFSQDYSETDCVPSNIFLEKVPVNKIYDRLYSTIYGTLKPQLFFDSVSKGLMYKTTRIPSLSPCSLLPVVDDVFGSGINRYTENFMKISAANRFCKAACVPLIHYLEQPRQTGSFYICRLIPMVKCTYKISIGINADDNLSFVELKSPGSRLIIQTVNHRVVLNSYFENSSGDFGSKTVELGNAGEKLDFEILFDGFCKTNTISGKDGKHITTPFYNLERQKLPYLDFSNGYLKFTSFILGKGMYLDVNIYSIKQKAERKLITAIGDNKLVPFGLDGPHARNTTEQGICYLNNKNNKGTLWFDIELLEKFSESDLEFLRSLVFDDSWDVGVHYSQELNDLPLEKAYKVMEQGYLYVYETIGRKPTSWCSMRNRDNVTHAIYAYEHLRMFWRNGESGIHAEKHVGNLDDDTWEWWEPASKAGMVYPVFTHELDLDPAIKYSISHSKFQDWVDNYNSNNMIIVSFYEYNQISCNTHDASFDILQYAEGSIVFNAHTNGFDALVNVNINAGGNTRVFDNTSKKILSYKLEQDNSLTFRVENKHTYAISLDSAETSG